jgi:hypothetical protein
MTFKGLGEMFEGDSADIVRRKISAHILPSGGFRVCTPGSKDPHRREQKLGESLRGWVSL